jgi:hypothetical protein
MRFFAIVAVGVVFLMQSASAQNRFEQQVRTQLDRVGENLAKKGFELTTQVYTGELGEEKNEEVSVRLRAGVRYAIVGVCDEDCKDLDIVLYTASGRELASDVGEDDVPVVEITPDREGTYMARAVMANCSAEPCSFGLGLFSASVDRFERQVREQLAQAAQKLGKSGFELTHKIYTGELRQNQDENVSVELDRGRGYVIVGVCDNDCKDVDLRLFNAAGREVDKDVERDDYPAVAVDVNRTEKYTVRASMAACSASPCRYGFGVFAK